MHVAVPVSNFFPEILGTYHDLKGVNTSNDLMEIFQRLVTSAHVELFAVNRIRTLKDTSISSFTMWSDF